MSLPTNITLSFHPKLNRISKGKELRDGLSAVTQIADTLWVVNDEGTSLERLAPIKSLKPGIKAFGCHERFPLADFLRLPQKKVKGSKNQPEVDVEGLTHADGYLWLVGSHSLIRPKPTLDEGTKRARQQLYQVNWRGNRYLLARIPGEETNAIPTLVKKAMRDGKKLVAAQLRGDDRGNDLTKALRQDEHLGLFLGIPGKDNGFDIEGLAVAGKRIFLGLRGPVLRGWAVILELELKANGKRPSLLQLKPIGPKGGRYRKHFLQLAGLGVRDLCVQGPDLLILAGPTMSLEGPVKVFRWKGGADPKGECMVGKKDLVCLLEVPHGDDVGHAEGMTLFSLDGGQVGSLMVVYDSIPKKRQSDDGTVTVDLFPLAGKLSWR
ncbi:MAG: DUF3616 domain-containing protein [Nitrospira sp.]|nr:DUF3616 domain-containing protein [Nitrospira sp.]